MMIALNLGVHWYTRFCRRSITGSGMAQLGDGVTDNPGGAFLLVGFCWDTLQGSYWTSSQSSLHSYGYRCQWGGMECCAVGSALSAGARAGQSSWILHPRRRRESPLPLEYSWEFLVPCYLSFPCVKGQRSSYRPFRSRWSSYIKGPVERFSSMKSPRAALLGLTWNIWLFLHDS